MAFDLRYRLWLFTEAHDALMAMRSADRRALDSILRLLINDPYLSGDSQERGDDGRMMEVRQFKKFLVTYWSDHAVKEVRVVRVERL